eukprot:m.105856 g.105856  ORF g.105856 m.105856 type:complete len:52 (-) comp10564_c0_seq1:246-401(-)
MDRGNAFPDVQICQHTNRSECPPLECGEVTSVSTSVPLSMPCVHTSTLQQI